ncbi:site-specific integrase, partial [Elizabethkingia argentiflava]|nr:site-specific integrase [Elizabethkingia argenteiflava]
MTITALLPLFLNYLKVEKRYSSHTFLSYENDLNGFIIFCKQDYETDLLKNILHLHIRSWIVSLMSDNNSVVTVNRKISTLRTFYKWALRKGYTTT